MRVFIVFLLLTDLFPALITWEHLEQIFLKQKIIVFLICIWNEQSVLSDVIVVFRVASFTNHSITSHQLTFGASFTSTVFNLNFVFIYWRVLVFRYTADCLSIFFSVCPFPQSITVSLTLSVAGVTVFFVLKINNIALGRKCYFIRIFSYLLAHFLILQFLP